MDKLKRYQQTRQCENVILGTLSHSGPHFLTPHSLTQQILMSGSIQGKFNQAQFSLSAVRLTTKGRESRKMETVTSSEGKGREPCAEHQLHARCFHTLSPLILMKVDPPVRCSGTPPRLCRKSVAQAGFGPRSGCSQVSYSFHYTQCGCDLGECPLKAACLPSGLCPDTSGSSGFSTLEPIPLGRDWIVCAWCHWGNVRCGFTACFSCTTWHMVTCYVNVSCCCCCCCYFQSPQPIVSLQQHFLKKNYKCNPLSLKKR